MTCCSSELAEERGQASVEAAALLPAVSLLALLLLQPLCLAYTQMVMREAASETARAAIGTADEERLEEFCRRRLAAVPEISIFSTGDWDIGIEGAEEQVVTVTISGHAEPLPLAGAMMAAQLESDPDGIVLRVQVKEQLRPAWLEGTYDDWIEVWDHG
ncbi:MAG: TadE/TadG family type IV pilus assembly protein [Atopobiaceae bacterium]